MTYLGNSQWLCSCLLARTNPNLGLGCPIIPIIVFQNSLIYLKSHKGALLAFSDLLRVSRRLFRWCSSRWILGCSSEKIIVPDKDESGTNHKADFLRLVFVTTTCKKDNTHFYKIRSRIVKIRGFNTLIVITAHCNTTRCHVNVIGHMMYHMIHVISCHVSLRVIN